MKYLTQVIEIHLAHQFSPLSYCLNKLSISTQKNSIKRYNIFLDLYKMIIIYHLVKHKNIQSEIFRRLVG